MELIPFQNEWLNLPDMELCIRVFDGWVRHAAELNGIDLDNLPDESRLAFFEQVRVASLALDSDNAKNSDLEKTIRKICAKDFERAAKVLREVIFSRKKQKGTDNYAAKGMKFKPGRQKGTLDQKTLYIRQLATKNPTLTAKQLFAGADKNIIGQMALKTFQNKVPKKEK